LYLNQGKYRQAESVWKHWPGSGVCAALIIDTITTLNGLALTCLGLGKRVEAESMFSGALDRNVEDPEHPQTLAR
jgi:hypothetical protein